MRPPPHPHHWLATFLVAVGVVSASCASLSGLSGGGGVDGGTHADGGDAATMRSDTGEGLDSGVTAHDAGACRSPVEGGTPGVLVLGEFCIDSTEAPVALYDKFYNDLNTNPDAGQPAECAWNSSYEPPYDPYQGEADRASKPQTAVDWCDALAYCKYWGKQLCGNRMDGGALDPTGPLKDGQWYAACTDGTSQDYPYGANYVAGACRAALPADAGAGTVPTSSTCQGGVPGLYDMSGNLAEWENSCTPSGGDAAADTCLMRGGTWFFPSNSVTCSLTTGGALSPRNGSDTSSVGIRCCWEPE